MTQKTLNAIVALRTDITSGRSRNPSGRSMESFLAHKVAEIQNLNDVPTPTSVSSRNVPLVTTTQRTSRGELHDVAEDQQVTKILPLAGTKSRF